MAAPNKNNRLKIILLRNYCLDEQFSMLHFAKDLEKLLSEACIPYEVIFPKVYLGNWSQRSFLKKWLGYIDKYIIFPLVLKKQLKTFDAPNTLIHILDHSNAVYVPIIKKYKHIVSCHDLIAIKAALGLVPEQPISIFGRILQKYILKGLNQANQVVCLSESTKNDFLALTKHAIPTNIPVIPIGLNYPYIPLKKAYSFSILANHIGQDTLKKGYLLHVGNDAWYKNRLGLLYLYKAYSQQTQNPLPLILVGPHLSKSMEIFCKTHSLTPIILNKLNNQELNALYSCANCMLFPSLYEGLGLPILEALASGCPVITTQALPMTNVGGPAAYYIPKPSSMTPHILNSWANKHIQTLILILKQSEEEKHTLIQRGLTQSQLFKPENTLKKYLAIYNI